MYTGHERAEIMRGSMWMPFMNESTKVAQQDGRKRAMIMWYVSTACATAFQDYCTSLCGWVRVRRCTVHFHTVTAFRPTRLS